MSDIKKEVLLTIEDVSSTSFTILEDDISRLTYVLKTIIQTIQFPIIILYIVMQFGHIFANSPCATVQSPTPFLDKFFHLNLINSSSIIWI